MKIINTQQKFMQAAIKEAKKAKQKGDYAIGAVVVKNNKIIAHGQNNSKISEDPTRHAEIIALRSAAKKLKSRHLKGCTLYTTIEPCPMCAGAMVLSMLDGIVFGSTQKDMKNYRLKFSNGDFLWRNFSIPAKKILQCGIPKIKVTEKFMHDECNELYHNNK